MPISDEVCFKCEKEVRYDENLDKADNDLIPKKVRKVVVDEKGNIAPLYSMPPDKRRLVGKNFIKFMCDECARKA